MNSAAVVREYEVYVPLFASNGRRISGRKLADLKARLSRQFGGLTYFPQRNQGLWEVGGHVYRDQIVILRVLANRNNDRRSFWFELKEHVQREWRQKSLLIVSRRVKLI